MKKLTVTTLAIVALFSCFIIAEAQVSKPPPPSPTLAKAFIQEYQGHAFIRGNWAYKIPAGKPDPYRIGDIRFRVTRKLYATIEDSVNGKGEGKETSTGLFSVDWRAGDNASGLINTLHRVAITPKKVNRLTVEMILTGTKKEDASTVTDFTWKQRAEGLFFGEGVK